MKTDIKIAFILILNAALAILILTCCVDDNHPSKMLWNVSSQDQENVEVTFDASRRPQIEIVASSEGGQCQIHCPNYQHVSFREKNFRANVHMDHDCQFHAKIIAPGVITINLDEMPQDNDEMSTYFIIDGDNGEEQFNTTVVKVTRQAHITERRQ